MGSVRLLATLLFLFYSSLLFAYQSDAGRSDSDESTTISTTKFRVVPRTVRFSGIVRGADGGARTGTAAVTFAVYSEAQGGSPLWLETQNVHLDEQGRYTVLLGSASDRGLPLALFATGAARWLGVRIAEEGAAEQPRVALVSVPYALTAADAQSLGGRPATDFQLTRAATLAAAESGDGAAAGLETSGAVSSTTNTTGKLAKFTGADTIGDSVVTELNGNIGVNIATPAATLSLGPAVGEKFDFYQSLDGSIRLGIGIDQVNGPRELNLFTTSPTLNGSGRITLGYRREDNGQFVGNVTILNSGNMGVGTSNPAATLSLGPAVGEKFDFYQSPDSSVRLGIGIDQVNPGRELNLFTTSPTLNGSGRITLGYRREDNGQFVGNMTILNSGNVGVGTSDPAATLSLGPAVGEKFDFYQSPDGSVRLGIGIDQVNGPRELNLFTTSPTLNGSGRITLGYRREDNGQFVGNVAIMNSGNVGIGSVFPSQRLEVAGTIYSTTGGFKFPDGSVQTTAASGGGVAGSCPDGQFVRAIAGGGVTCATDQTVGLNLPVSASGSTAAGAFKITQTNTVSLGSDPTFATAQQNIPAAITGIASSTSTTSVAVGVIGFNSTLGPAVVGWNGSTAAGEDNDAPGVLGTTDNPSGKGVLGEANHTTGANYGVDGLTESTAGTAVRGRARSTTGSTVGVRGEVESASGIAVYGFANVQGGGSAGIAGKFESLGGIPLIASAGGSNVFVVGADGVTNTNKMLVNSLQGGNPLTVQAGGTNVMTVGPGGVLTAGSYAQSSGNQNEFNSTRISGTLQVTGSFSKGSGTFKIDHPLDPKNKYLYHSFVESPDMMNIYNGVTLLDAKGEAWVSMPEWFEALNMDFRYQLTAIGRPLPNLFVAAEMKGNRFKIAGGKANAKVSWQVTGIRHDAYANAHRVKVEEEKPLTEQGTYLHPDAFTKKTVAHK
jgi:hypothetical protein